MFSLATLRGSSVWSCTKLLMIAADSSGGGGAGGGGVRLSDDRWRLQRSWCMRCGYFLPFFQFLPFRHTQLQSPFPPAPLLAPLSASCIPIACPLQADFEELSMSSCVTLSFVVILLHFYWHLFFCDLWHLFCVSDVSCFLFVVFYM